MENWYVYYSLPAAQCSTVLPRVQTMQRQLAAANGVSVRLERRVDDGTTPTMMEIYERVADPRRFAAALEIAVDAAQFAPELSAARRLERFEPV